MKRTHLILLVLLSICSLSVLAQPTSITLLKPAGGETYRAGTSNDFRWDTTGTNGSRFVFQFSTTPNGPWDNLPLPNGVSNVLDSTSIPSGNVGGRGQYLFGFRAPGVNTTSGYVRMVLLNRDGTPNFNVTSRNQVPFTITQPAPIKVDSVLTGNITGTVTLQPTKIYGLAGFVWVQNGGVLRILPGTVVVGDAPGVNSAIIINRGGKILADGTKEKPIVFTSRAPAGQRDRGDWGGILICGRAATNHPGGEAVMEGFPSDPVNARFGGGATPDDNDNSGILRYVRIEFGGIALFPNQEINGLTLGAVGRGTIIENVQVSYSGDDSYEWFGGTVDSKRLISYNGIDDDFDTDNGFRGRIQFALAKRFRQVADQSTSQAFESDNDASGSRNLPVTSPIFANCTFIGPLQDTSMISGSSAQQYNRLYGSSSMVRRNSRLSLFNSLVIGWPNTMEFGNPNGGFTADAASRDSLQFRNNTFIGIKAGSPGWRGTVPAGSTGFTSAWLLNPDNANEVINRAGNIEFYCELGNAYAENSNMFSAVPTINAPYIASASFTRRGSVAIDDSYFEKVTYRGAFSPDLNQRWDAGWAEYDPINKEYKAQPSLKLVTPAGGEKYIVGQKVKISWDTTSTAGLALNVQFGTGVNGPWTAITGSPVVDTGATRGNIQWTVPNTVTKTGFIRLVSATDSTITSRNDFGFEISLPAPPPPPTVRLIKPAGGEVFRAGSSQTLQWDTTGTNGQWFKFQWATAKDGPWTDISLPGTAKFVLDSTRIPSGMVGGRGTYAFGFRVPATATTTGYVRMMLVNKKDSTPDLSNISSNATPFTITQAKPVAVDSLLSGNITTSLTLTPKKIYGLSGIVYVQSGAVLTILPGTIVVGDAPGVNSALVINRGAKIIANGTAQKPIVFTSRAPVGQRDRGDWGGILICGRAATNHPGGEAVMEGFPSDPVNARFGGGANPDNNDNSGILRYVRIEFGGIALFPNQEINGLTLGAVGRGTTIENVQVSYSGDDSYEWFGGNVDGKKLISYNGIDDDFDTDNGYSGRNQFILGKRFRQIADQSSSQAFESDNDGGGTFNAPLTSAVFSNVTAIGPVQDTAVVSGSDANQFNRLYAAAMMIRRNSRQSIVNSLFVGWPNSLEFGNPNAGFTADAASRDSLQVRNNTFIGIKAGSPGWRNAVPAGSTSFTAAWLTDAKNANQFINRQGPIAAYNDLSDAFVEASNAFTPVPKTGAPYLSGSDFTKRGSVAIDDQFFENVPYRGAFAADIAMRWDLPWAEYDPVNKDYKAEVDTVVNRVDDRGEALGVSVQPNPATGHTRVRYTLNEAGPVNISIINALGMEVVRVAESVMQDAGIYEFLVDAESLSSGGYVLRIASTSVTASTPFVVVH